MAVKYTDEQLLVIKAIAEMSERFADQILHIMQNHGLDKIPGTEMTIDIDPSMSQVMKQIEFGRSLFYDTNDSGYFKLTRGKDETGYALNGRCSYEYEVLFAPVEVTERIRKVLNGKVELYPAGEYGNPDCGPAPVDSGV